MKRITAFILTLFTVLLCGCKAEPRQKDTTPIFSAIEDMNAQTRLSGKYMVEISFGEGSVLYYANGDISWDRNEETVFSDFDQTYLGVSAETKNYYSQGKMVSLQNGKALTEERSAEDMFSKFPYFQIALPSGDISTGSNTSGDTYSFKISDTKWIADAIVGEDVYELATVLKKPQKDKTQYGEASCIYTAKDGRLISCRYEFDIKLFDTPAYNPNYSQPESEYTITLHVTAKVSYDETGAGIEIPEYSADTSF